MDDGIAAQLPEAPAEEDVAVDDLPDVPEGWPINMLLFVKELWYNFPNIMCNPEVNDNVDEFLRIFEWFPSVFYYLFIGEVEGREPVRSTARKVALEASWGPLLISLLQASLHKIKVHFMPGPVIAIKSSWWW